MHAREVHVSETDVAWKCFSTDVEARQEFTHAENGSEVRESG